MKKAGIVGGILILSGILVILYAFVSKYVTSYKQNNMVKNYEKEIKSHKINVKPSTNDNTLGILSIPKIGLKVAIGDGTDMKTLKYAVGHFKNSAFPGQKGNFALAGHRSYTYGQYFNRLDELKIGDEISVETLKGTYRYKVYNTKVVLPDRVDVLNPTKDATMTLVTCTPVRIATHRLIISAILIKAY